MDYEARINEITDKQQHSTQISKIDGDAAKNIFEQLCKNFAVGEAGTRFERHRDLLANASKQSGDATDPDTLLSILNDLGLGASHIIYLNYLNFEEVFGMELDNMLSAWDKLYLPACDEIEIFDDSVFLDNIVHGRC